MADQREEALELVTKALDMLETEGSKLTPVLQICQRIARLRNNEQAERYFTLELRGYGSEYAKGAAWAPFAAMSGRHATLNAQKEQTYWVGALPVLESEYELGREELAAMKIPVASISEMTDRSQYNYMASLQQSVTEKVLDKVIGRRNTAQQQVARAIGIITVVRGVTQSWLVDQLMALRYGSIVDSALTRTKQRVDSMLERISPEAGRALAAAFARHDSPNAEDWSQALGSCRRALKALADSLYPPGPDVDGHPLGADNYVNRLTEFAKQHLKSKTQGELLGAEIDSLWKRADLLNDLSSKGVHNTVDASDLDMTVVRTYLLAGELLSLVPEESLQAPVPQGVTADGVESGDAQAVDGAPQIEQTEIASLAEVATQKTPRRRRRRKAGPPSG